MLTEKLRFLSFFKSDQGGDGWDTEKKDLFILSILIWDEMPNWRIQKGHLRVTDDNRGTRTGSSQMN